MQDSPVMMREDVTVSLNKDMIDEMLGIAEVRGITLSSLVRDILGAFCRSYRRGSDWTVSDNLPVLPLPVDAAGGDSIDALRVRVAAHDDLLAGLQARIQILEGTLPSSSLSGIPVFPVSTPAALHAGMPHENRQLSAVIDCDSPSVSTVSSDALVKFREPVSPIITSVDVSSLGRIDPNKPYSQTEAAVILRVSISTLRKYVKEGKISSHKVGRSSVFQGQELLTFLGRSS